MPEAALIFKLSEASYEEIRDHQGRFWMEEAQLGLGLWRGRYLKTDQVWLRWYDRAGNWIPTSDERAEQEQQRAEQEQQRAEQERQRAEQERKEKEDALRKARQASEKAQQLEAKLRELGIDPDRT